MDQIIVTVVKVMKVVVEESGRHGNE